MILNHIKLRHITSYLNSSNPFTHLFSHLFFAAVMTAVRFVRKPDSDAHTVCVELYKREILEKRIIQAEAASVAKCPDADTVSLQVLTTLIHYLTENAEAIGQEKVVSGQIKNTHNVKEGENTVINGTKRLTIGPYGESPTEGKDGAGNVDKDDKKIEENADRMFSKGDVLEALSDCVVVLRRLPVLLTQYKLSGGISLPGYVLRQCLCVCIHCLNFRQCASNALISHIDFLSTALSFQNLSHYGVLHPTLPHYCILHTAYCISYMLITLSTCHPFATLSFTIPHKHMHVRIAVTNT